MKRSMMIKAIHDRLNGTPIDHDNYADQFLTVVEELGMRAPLWIAKDPGHFPGDSFNYSSDDWEPEDET